MEGALFLPWFRKQHPLYVIYKKQTKQIKTVSERLKRERKIVLPLALRYGRIHWSWFVYYIVVLPLNGNVFKLLKALYLYLNNNSIDKIIFYLLTF